MLRIVLGDAVRAAVVVVVVMTTDGAVVDPQPANNSDVQRRFCVAQGARECVVPGGRGYAGRTGWFGRKES